MKPRWLIVLLGLAMVGCLSPRTRLQKSDDPDGKEADVRTVGDVADVVYERTEVMGVGLVVGLNGTGGGMPPASAYRDMLENDLKKQRIQDVKGVLGSPSCAMVLVSGVLPAGARKGDVIDVEITLPEQSRCTSLRGGYLTACRLFNYDSTGRLNPGHQGPNQLLKGHALVSAEGPVVVGDAPLTARDAGEDDTPKRGRVWGGGRCRDDSAVMLVINRQYPSRVAALVADRINQTFAGARNGRDPVAVAKDKSLITLAVPMQYRLNLEHYLRVVRAIPLQGVPAADSAYRKRLADQLQDPAVCLSAAVRLEALGEESVPTLKAALTAPSPVCRFAAAHALAYLRKPACADELTKLVRTQPVFRMLGLAALASLDEYACRSRLAEMMADADPEVRYGAFRALHTMDERAAEIPGTRMNEAFWVHQVARDSQPLVHLLTSRRPEVVLFGDKQALVAPFALSVGDEFTVVAKAGESVCTVKRFSVKHGQPVRQCSLDVADVLKNLADIGGGWADAADLLKKADAQGKLSCDLKLDALPKPATVQDLAKLGKDDPMLRSALGSAPALFQGGQ